MDQGSPLWLSVETRSNDFTTFETLETNYSILADVYI